MNIISDTEGGYGTVELQYLQKKRLVHIKGRSRNVGGAYRTTSYEYNYQHNLGPMNIISDRGVYGMVRYSTPAVTVQYCTVQLENRGDASAKKRLHIVRAPQGYLSSH